MITIKNIYTSFNLIEVEEYEFESNFFYEVKAKTGNINNLFDYVKRNYKDVNCYIDYNNSFYTVINDIQEYIEVLIIERN